MNHLIVFRATGHCARCSGELVGRVTHHAVILTRGIRVLSDDPGVIAWGPCPAGCMDHQCYPATGVVLTGLSEASQVLVNTERERLVRV